MWNDRRLARRAARGDKDAFAAIFRRYQQDLYRYCVAILGNEQDAQDALQNTMVKALGALPGERRQIELKPWLYRVAHNESIELRRRARPTTPLAEDLRAPDASPEQRASDRGRLRHLLADIGELPERHRAALVMRELAGLDFEEIGTALDTSAGAVRQVVYQARCELQRMSEGREMRCDAVATILSDRDGRVTRRRDVRAHLRDCAECRLFAAGMRSRAETLAGIAPLPAVVAAAIAKGALAGGGAAGTGASTAGAAASGGAAGASTSAAGVAGGAAAKVASTGAILKSAAGIFAVVAVGAVAADHGHLLHAGGSRAGGGHASPAVVAEVGSPGPGAEAPRAGGSGRTGADVGSPRSAFKPEGVERVGLEPPAKGAKAAPVEPRVDDLAPIDTSSAAVDVPVADDAVEPPPPPPSQPTPTTHAADPWHADDHGVQGQQDEPAEPTPPGHSEQWASPDHADQSAHRDKSAQPPHGKRSPRSEDREPSKNQREREPHAAAPSHGADRWTPTTSSHPERAEHPQQSQAPWQAQSQSTAVDASNEDASPAAETHPEHPEHPESSSRWAAAAAEATVPVETADAPAEPEATEPTHLDKVAKEETAP